MTRLVLASTSPYRRELLARLGLPFEALAPACDEDALKRQHPGLDPAGLAALLAEAKARSIADRDPEAIVIGSDQICHRHGERLGKPGSVERACAQLARLAGGSHELLTAMAVCHRGRIQAHCDRTTLHMLPLDAEQIAAYVGRDRPLDCAGAYKLEAGGIALFSRIESADFSAIQGLPLLALGGMLRACGLRLP